MQIKKLLFLGYIVINIASNTVAKNHSFECQDALGKKVTIALTLGDITKQSDVQIIVNAANTGLRGGSGVDGAICKATGNGLLQELTTRYPNGGITGNAYPTNSYNLSSQGIKHIIHAIGPDFRIARKNTDPNPLQVLSNTYKNSLEQTLLLAKNDAAIKKIAFPSISTGIYQCPLQGGATTAICTIVDFIKNQQSFPLDEIRFVFKDAKQDEIMGNYMIAVLCKINQVNFSVQPTGPNFWHNFVYNTTLQNLGKTFH